MRVPGLRIAALGAVALVAAALSGCGVSPSAARAIPAAQVPANLRVQTPPTATTAPPGAPPLAHVNIYLLTSAQQCSAVQRDIPVPTTPASSLTAVIDELLAGPVPADTNAGLFTAIPAPVRLLSSSVSPTGLATLNFNFSFEAIAVGAQVQAVAQIVFTATDPVNRTGATSVAFQINGVPTPVPISTGATTMAPVSPSQYASLGGP
jgi:spore germination protein GerM